MRPGESQHELAEPLKSYADEAGLVMRRPPLTPYSMYALEATEYAKEQELFDPFHRGLYRAFWEDSKDIGDLSVIRDVAEGTGLDWPSLEQRLESRYYEEKVMRQYREAMDLGINGIPGFVIGKYMFTGAQGYDVFKAVVERVLHEEDA